MAHQLNKTQFDVLYTLSTRNQPTTQRQLQTLTGHSLGKINTAVRDLENLGYLSQKLLPNSAAPPWNRMPLKMPSFSLPDYPHALHLFPMNGPKEPCAFAAKS